MEVVQEDLGEGSMHCTDHPYKNNTPGGICAFCLQEKLGKLVSSSFPVAVFPSSSSSPSPSFRSDIGSLTTSTVHTNASFSSANANHKSKNVSYYHHDQYYSRRTRIPFLLIHRKKKQKDVMAVAASTDHTTIVFERSKSTNIPRRNARFLEGDDGEEDYGRRGFWSFLYSSSKQSSSKKTDRPCKEICHASAAAMACSVGSSSMNGSCLQQRSRERKKDGFEVVDENESPDQVSFDRKVSRSRSVGCGSRSFSGDFFERLSTGFGDCTLRRVESQREGKPKVSSVDRNGSTCGGGSGQDCIKERVKCGGIFSGFMTTSSSSFLVSSSNEDNVNGKVSSSASAAAVARHLSHGRNRSWGWAFASPMRAFIKPSSDKREATNKIATPNLAAIPSLLTLRG